MLRVPQYGRYDFRLGAVRLGSRSTAGPFSPSPRAAGRDRPESRSHVGSTSSSSMGSPGRLTHGPKLEWRSFATAASEGTPDLSGWQTIAPYQTVPVTEAQGLFGTIRGGWALPEQRLDGTIATGGLRDDVNAGGVRSWRSGRATCALRRQAGTGSRCAPGTRSSYRSMAGRSFAPVRQSTRRPEARSFLRAGRRPVVLTYRVNGSGGRLEWSWRPSGGRESIVPPSALEPPLGKGVSTFLPSAAQFSGHARDVPLVVVN